MISYLLTSAEAETLKAILQGAGLEILTAGGLQEVAEFFVSERDRLPEHLAVIFLVSRGQEVEALQADEGAPAGEGGLPA